MAIEAILKQLGADGRDRGWDYTVKKLAVAEQNSTANERELLALMSSVQRFQCYLEGSTFDVLTDNQAVKNFMTKKSVSRREARCLDTLALINIREMNLVHGEVHVTGDSLPVFRIVCPFSEWSTALRLCWMLSRLYVAMIKTNSLGRLWLL